jgi:acyl-CoA thioesterase II
MEPGGTGRYEGLPATDVSARLFGGQAMAQALAAAAATVDHGRLPVSAHAVFLRPGGASQRLQLDVTNLRDGRAYATRRVDVSQDGRVISQVLTQWHKPEDSSMRFDPGATVPPRPHAQSLPYPAPGVVTEAFDCRWADTGNGRGLWFRLRSPLRPDPTLHAAAALYISDLWLLDTALRRVGRRFDDPAVRGSTLEHSAWFHRTLALDGWSYLESCAVGVADGRALVRARLLSDGGDLLASFTQGASVRDKAAGNGSATGREKDGQ